MYEMSFCRHFEFSEEKDSCKDSLGEYIRQAI